MEIRKSKSNGIRDKLEEHTSLYNFFMLGCIHGYDRYGNLEFLQLANKINEMIKNKSKEVDEIYLINYYQIKKRQRDFNDSDINKLIELKSKFSEDYKIICAANILLENHIEFEFNYKKLDEITKKEFKSWPLWTLKNKKK